MSDVESLGFKVGLDIKEADADSDRLARNFQMIADEAVKQGFVLDKAFKDNVKSISEANSKIVELKRSMSGMDTNSEEYKKLDKELEGLNNELGELSKKGLTAGTTIGGLKNKIAEMERELQGLDVDSGEFKKLNKELGETRDKLSQVSGATEKTESTFSQLKNVIGFAAIAASAKELVGDIINVRAEFEKYEAVLTNSLGSSVLAKKALGDLTEKASETPFALKNLTDAYVKLTNYGLQPSMDEMTAYGDISASVGKDIVDFSEAVADATSGEFERLKEFGIKASKEGDKVSLTFKGQTTQIQNSSDAIKNYLVSIGQMEGVSGSMDAISKTLGGSISNLGDSWDKLMNTLGGESSGAFSVAIKGLSSLVDMINTAVKSSETLRKEAVQEAIGGSAEPIKQEIQVMTSSLVKNGMSESDAQKHAVELYQKQLDEQIAIAEESVKKADDIKKKADESRLATVLDPLGLIGSGKRKDANEAQEEAQKNLDILKGQKEILPTLFAEKKIEVKPVVSEGTLKELEKQLKVLTDKKGSFFNVKDEANNADAIIKKTQEIERYKLKIQQTQKDETILKPIIKQLDATVQTEKELAKIEAIRQKLGIENLNEMTDIQKAQYNNELEKANVSEDSEEFKLASMKTLTDEQKNQLELAQQQSDVEADKWEKIQKNIAITIKSGEFLAQVLGMAGNEISQYDEKLGNSLSELSGFAAGFSDIMKASQEDETATLEDYASILKLAVEYNKWMVNNVWSKIPELFGKDTNLKEGETAWDRIMQKIFGASDALEEFNALLGTTIDELLQIDTERLGFSSNDIAKELADGIAEGLDSSDELFQSFLTRIFKQAIMEQITAKYLPGIMMAFDAMYSDGVISDVDVAMLGGMFDKMFVGSKAVWDSMSSSMGKLGIDENSTADNTMKGSFQGLSEDTGRMLDGKMNSLQLATIDIKNSTIEMRGLMIAQAESLRIIAGNTSYNWHLESMAAEMTGMKVALKTIQENTSVTNSPSSFTL